MKPSARLAATALSLAASALTAAANERPNIIYIMCDDMGYGDLACYGQRYITTPNIDRMAREGMRFTQAYAGSPVSAPSRACFMTGQHTGHTHVRGNKEYWSGRNLYGNNPDYAIVGQEPYDVRHAILPEIFKDNGYTTGMFGKWAGGYEGSPSTPDLRGIDEFYGYICQFQAHLYYPNFLNTYSRRNGDTRVGREVLTGNIGHPMYGPGYEERTEYSADLIHRRALEWLDRQTPDKPFLGIFTYTLPHAELAQPDDSLLQHYRQVFTTEKTYAGSEGSRYNPTDCGHAQFAAMISRLDRQVGEVLDKLRERGLDDNTLVIFTSDNGPHEEGGADPDFFNRRQTECHQTCLNGRGAKEEDKVNRDGLLQGKKRSTYEGGIRIPFIAWWPGKVAPQTVNPHQLAFYDILPTFCEVAGIKDFDTRYVNPGLPGDGFDGISFAPTLLGKAGQREHGFLYWEFHETDMMAVRMGDWKLVVKKGKCRLYDLATDIHEDHDVAMQHPDIVAQMKDIIRREHVESEIFKVTLPE